VAYQYKTNYKELDEALTTEAEVLGAYIIPRFVDVNGAADVHHKQAGIPKAPAVFLAIQQYDVGNPISEARLRVRGEDLTLTKPIRPTKTPGVPIVVNNGKKHGTITIGSVYENTVYLNFNLPNFINAKRYTRTARGKTGNTDGSFLPKLFAQHLRPAFQLAAKFDEGYSYADEKRVHVQNVLKTQKTVKKELERKISVQRRSIANHIQAIEQATSRLGEMQQTLAGLEADQVKLAKKGETRFRIFNSLWGNGIHDLRIEPTHIIFLTAPIFSEGLPFGRFWVTIPRGADRQYSNITIKAENNTYNIGGYVHPHIHENGSICWGTAGTVIAQFRGRGQEIECIPIILEYLRTYHHDHQYRAIEYWDEKFGKKGDKKRTDRGSRWRECYSKVTDPYECAGCFAPECPYRDGAEDRCYRQRNKKQEYIRCMQCKACNNWKHAKAACRKNHQQDRKDCVGCPVTSCTYAEPEKVAKARKPRRKTAKGRTKAA